MIKRILLHFLCPLLAGMFVIFAVNILAFLSGVPRDVDFSMMTFVASLLTIALAAIVSFVSFVEYGLGKEKK